MTALTTRKALSKIKNFIQDEEAASAAEYGILAALVAVFIIGAVSLFGDKLKATFTKMSTGLDTVNAK